MLGSAAIPVIRLRSILIVPVQGIVADEQSARLAEDVLRHVQTSDVRGVVIDVSGASLLDSHLCSVIARLSEAVAIMGTRSVLCGLKADLVMTLISMGIELRNVKTVFGLEEALEQLGIGLVEQDEEDDDVLWALQGADEP